MTLKPLDQALNELRAVPDPYARLSEAHDLDSALAMARSVVAQIKRDTINILRGTATGYGTIAQRLGLTKARVQQIANAPRNPGLAAAYAFRDEHGGWHGEPTLLPKGRYRESLSFIPFSPADKYNPLGGQLLTVRYGDVDEDYGGERVHPANPAGQRQPAQPAHDPPRARRPVRSAHLRSARTAAVEAAREQRQRELGG